jgi:hypothetical protein
MLKPAFLALVLAALALVPAHAGAPLPLPPPEGEVLLTVTGAISVTNVDGAAAFDRAALGRLRAAEVVTGTVWTDGISRFVGVPLQAVLDRVGAPRDGRLRLVALNDYSVAIPAQDLSATVPMLALERDGAPMSVRDKGPIWVIYPYDSGSEWRSEQVFSRSIWQLNRIEVMQ